MHPVGLRFLLLAVLATALAASPAAAADDAFKDDFSAGLDRWRVYFAEGMWTAREGVLTSAEPKDTTGRLAQFNATADVLIRTEVRCDATGRCNFGVILRAQDDGTCFVVRYYDAADALELLAYKAGQVQRQGPASGKLQFAPDRWYRFKAAVVEDLILAKLWPADAAQEPDWQLRATCPDRRPGGAGLLVDDGSRVDFGPVHISSGGEVAALRRQSAQDREARLKSLEAGLQIRLEETPFVVRSSAGPHRRLLLRTLLNDKPEPVDGRLELVCGQTRSARDVKTAEFADGAYEVQVPEPAEPTHVGVTFTASFGKRLTAGVRIAPARRWTFHMTPHTHYDIGFTEPQPKVIDRLSSDMDAAVRFCEETADWPPESRYRWIVEVSGLFKNYAERHTPDQVARFIELVRQGRIEICGYYLNMPTELVGHEELIRCLYYAEGLRRKYGITIDTAMINDVPGYAWALPQLFSEFGIRRVAFRANSIRGQFLWYRSGAVERPFYWEGPAGHRIFVWYTDSYREGNFFRAPGLHEADFLNVIRQNERAGTWVDEIQLRMGGDNLPPEFNTSKNARAWNEKYLWPRVVVSTNREYLELLEKRYGARTKTYRGDIPSWWAEGPASSALETGMNRLVHDRLVAAEALWTLLRLTRSDATYPRERIDRAYDRMLHYDEHTWGASCSIDRPTSEETAIQWRWKAQCAYDAEKLTTELYQEAIKGLSAGLRSGAEPAVAVWNTLAWSRTDVVELKLTGSPVEGAPGLVLIDQRTGQPSPAQLDADGQLAWFIARDVPALGCAVYKVQRTTSSAKAAAAAPPDLESPFYRLQFDPGTGRWTSLYDRQLQRELVDRGADHSLNQPLREVPTGGRAAIDRKQPVEFRRTAAAKSRLSPAQAGPVFSEQTSETALPFCPRIRQTVRLYQELKIVDIINVVEKEETFEPEGVYFAFPFDVPGPEFRVQIADASMRPGKDQPPQTCHDFYSIQHWTNIAGDGFAVVLAPVEAPIVVLGDLNVYKWADRLDFPHGRLYSLVMNNYWSTNFKAGQSGTLKFRYRLTSYAGPPDAIRDTHFAWQPFQPLEPAWIAAPRAGAGASVPPQATSAIRVEGDPIIVSCVKTAETGDAVIVRLLEVRGAPAKCTLRLSVPGVTISKVFRADVVERPFDEVPVRDGGIDLALKPNEIVTVGMVAGKP